MGTLPGTQTRAMWTLALFAAIQLADGAMTAAGVAKFGPGAEGNPVLQFAAAGAGFGATLVAAKLVAITGAAVLHAQSRHLMLAVLTLAYVLGAIVPWTFVLSTAS